MDLKKFKTLALVAVVAGLATQPVQATGEQTVAEDNYYVRSCGGEHSCGAGYPKPYNQTNPAPVAMDEDNAKMTPPGQAPAPTKNGTQPAPVQGQKPGSTTSNSRYYQKRDRDVADNAPNFSPSNGLLPDQQKGTGTNSSKTKTGTGTTSTSPSSSTSGYGSGSSSTMNSGR